MIELLVVIAIIAILAAILLPVLESAQARGYQASCMSNLHQQGAAFTIYASDSNGKYPDLRYAPFCSSPGTPFGSWPWDVSTNFASAMISDGCTRNVFYDPANAAFNNNQTWNFYAGFSIVDYVYLIPGAGWATTTGGGVSEQPYWKTNDFMIPGSQVPATSELVVDTVIYDSATKNYADIAMGSFGGLPGNPIQRTSHLAGGLPSGGNELYEDGHVQWVPWSHMYNLRSFRYFGGNSAPYFIF